MATSYTYPGVYIQELESASHPITGVATSITAFVGYTQSGIDSRAQAVLSFPDFERLYGGLAANSELSYAVQQFFQNGGAQAYVVRTPGTSAGAVAATVQFGAFTFYALSSGAAANGNLLMDVDYIGLKANSTTGDPRTFNLTVTDEAAGTSEYFPSVTLDNTKSNFVQTIVNDPDNGSQLVNIRPPVTVALLAGPMTQTGIVGTAVTPYSVASALCGATVLAGTVTLTSGSSDVQGAGTTLTSALKFGQWVVFGGDVTNTPYQIQSIRSDTDLTLTQNYSGANSAGGNVSVPNAQATANFGLALNTTHPVPAPAGLPLTVQVVAQHSIVPQSLGGLATQIQQAINSVLSVNVPGATVTVTVTSLTGVAGGQALRINALLPNNPDAVLNITAPAAVTGLSDGTGPLGIGGATANVAHYTLGTGHAGWASQTTSTAGVDGGLPATTDLIGDPAAFTGIYALQKVDLFNLLCIPDATRANPSDPNALDPSVNLNAIAAAAIALCDQRRAMLLIDPPPNVNTVASAVDWKSSGLAVVNPNGAAFFPRLRLPDPLNGYQLRTFAPCGVVAGVYATTDSTRHVWKAPAGTAASLSGVQSMVYKLSDAENGLLNPLGLNCFRSFPVYGAVLWGARTLVGADANPNQWKYVPVRRTALFIEQSLYNGTQWVVFEPNDEPLWAAIRLNVGSFMQNLFVKGAFQGSTPAQAYFVKCDGETTTQADIDLGIVNILVGFAPLKPAEFVVIQIAQITAQAQA
jgi:phage tail sheath protein FI